MVHCDKGALEQEGNAMSTTGLVQANGQHIYYEVHGEGFPLVLVMGIGYDSTLWKLAQVPALAQQFKVVIFDNRDVGRSSNATSAYTVADMSDDTAALLDVLNIQRAHVLGLSMGGMIAQQFALRHADRLDHLVLSGCGAAQARAAFDPIQVWNWVKANDLTGEAFASTQFNGLFSTTFLRNKDAVTQTIAMLSSNPHPVGPDAYNRQAQAYLKYNALDDLAGIKAPTMVVVGEQDLLTPPWVCEEVASRIPGAKFVTIKGNGASHAVPLERPDEFNQLVTKFLIT